MIICQRIILLFILTLILLCHTARSQQFSDDFFKALFELFPEDQTNFHPIFDSDVISGFTLAFDKIKRYIKRKKNFIPNLKPAQEVKYLNENSTEVADLAFHSRLDRTINCRRSFDNWDCDDCLKALPDGRVIRAFGTYPLDTVGQIVISKKKRTIYVMIRGANSARNQKLARVYDLVDHHFIPNAKVHRGAQLAVEDIKDIIIDTLNLQTRLHSTYRVHVIGHSFGASIASLITVEIERHVRRLNHTNLSGYFIGKPRVGNEVYAQYIRDRKLDMKRLIHLSDSVPNVPLATVGGYTHEGTEYWEYAIDPPRLFKCEGNWESRDCSNSLETRNILDHMIALGTDFNCKYTGG